MDHPTLRSRLKDAESLVQRLEENIAFQGRMIATLDRGGHDVKGGKDVPEAAAGYARETRRRQGPIVQGTGEPLVGPSVEGGAGVKRKSGDDPARRLLDPKQTLCRRSRSRMI
jgi:hypothetical protein